MWHSSFFYSILLHTAIILALFISIPSWKHPDEKPQSVPILIDLKNIKIAEKTHLPVKGEKVESSKPVQKTTSALAPKKVEKIVPVEKETPRPESKALLDKMPAVKNKPKPVAKPVVPPSVKPPAKPKKSDEEDMEQLLASVEKMGKNLKSTSVSASAKNKTEGQDKGIKGGVSSDEGETLTISQIDFISTTVRKYWNRDLGIEGAENMKIDLRIFLDSTGHVRNVEFSDQARYHSDAGYRSMAESARRAVYMSDRLEAPFVVVPEKLRREDIVFTFIP